MARQASARRSRLARSFEQALALHRQGRRDEAERIYDAILAADPHHCDTLHLRGVLRYQQGEAAEGLRLVAAALRAQPRSADVLSSYGVILDALKRHDEALASFDKVLAMRSNDAGAHYNRGNALKGLGRHAEALASYDRALALAPGLVDAHYNRGNVLRSLGRFEEAVSSYEAALAAAPDRPDILTNCGVALLELDRCEEALSCCEKALARDPENIFILTNRANAFLRLKRQAEALASYDRVLALNPDHAEALTGRGTALAILGRTDEALASFDQALRIEPRAVAAHVNRGNIFMASARMQEALASYGKAIELDPEHADANFNAALARLCLGAFRDGWRQYEYRLKKKEFAPLRRAVPQPLWRGEEDLHGKTILLLAEQGLGDAIQFARYAPLVAARGAKVLLGVQRPLVDLLATVPGVAGVYGENEPLPEFELHCPLLSLPLAFETELATIPANVPYIRAYEERIAKWRGRLPDGGWLRVGICWAGTTAHSNNRRRSIPLESFAAVLSAADVDFVSLQKDVDETDAAMLRALGVVQLGQEFEDFADTAAVVAMLDLVIAVDTSVAHLAGAMGKAVGLLVPFAPDFRWLLERTDSPWYPTMRLFRQSAIDDWRGPLERVRQELAAVAAKPR
jgi:tetratricopeptide (TPR) repeat protein